VTIKRTGILFITVGVGATLTDYCIYKYLTLSNLQPEAAKILSFMGGTVVGYFGNTRVTFKSKSGNLFRYGAIYFVSLVLNTTINMILRFIFDNLTIAWLIATCVSVSVNFLGLRYFVFRENRRS